MFPTPIVPGAQTWDYFPELAVITLVVLIVAFILYWMARSAFGWVRAIQKEASSSQNERDKNYFERLEKQQTDFTNRLAQRDTIYLNQIGVMTDSFQKFMAEERSIRGEMLDAQKESIEKGLASILSELCRAQDGIDAARSSIDSYHNAVSNAIEEMRRKVSKEQPTTPVKKGPRQ